jgi:hypothetical protein
MTIKSKEKQYSHLKRAVITGHRRRKGLCIRCGKNPHDGDCIEIYETSDTRNEEKSEEKNLDLRRKKDVIIIYRKKKLLCIRCGREHHNGSCEETYEIADNRTDEERRDRPATIPTPKFKPIGIIEAIDTQKNKDISIKLQKTIDIKLHRDYIALSILKSEHDNIVEFSCLNMLSRKYKDYIICIIGDIDKNFTYSEILRIKKMVNIRRISNDQQDIINHLYGCKILYSFRNDYTDYCQKYGIKVYVFEEKKNVTSILKESNIRS